MRIVIDTHFHVDERHDFGAALRSAARNLADIGERDDGQGDVVLAAILVDKNGERLFRQIWEGTKSLEHTGFRVGALDEDESILLEQDDGPSIFLIAGRQIITAEGLHFLVLTGNTGLGDGAPVGHAISATINDGLVPVLPWTPRKWFITKRKIIRRTIVQATPEILHLGDISLRPSFLPEPALMARGRARGMRVLAGSDPLPVAGEERFAGSYATIIDGAFERERAATSIRNLLRNPFSRLRTAGERTGPMLSLQRALKHTFTK